MSMLKREKLKSLKGFFETEEGGTEEIIMIYGRVCVTGMGMAGTEPRENPSASLSNGASDLSDNLITIALHPVH